MRVLAPMSMLLLTDMTKESCDFVLSEHAGQEKSVPADLDVSELNKISLANAVTQS